MENHIKNLYRKFPSIRNNLEKVFPNIVLAKSQLLAAVSKACLGQVMVKGDPDLACASNVNKIARIAIGCSIGGDVSTYRMYGIVKSSPRFVRVYKPKTGCLIISPTGHGGRLKHGHVGYFLDDFHIASNSSDTGMWTQNYTMDTWREKYLKNGFPVCIFMVL